MYDYFVGKIVKKTPTFILIEVGGIGYHIHIPVSTYENLPDAGEIKIFIYLYVREDKLKLFGFSTVDERNIFEHLLSVSGVGPNLGLKILSGSSVSEIVESISNKDSKALEMIKGIGKKTAERIVLELQEVMNMMELDVERKMFVSDAISDSVLGLISLGYSKAQSEKAIKKAISDLGRGASAEDLLKEGLKRI